MMGLSQMFRSLIDRPTTSRRAQRILLIATATLIITSLGLPARSADIGLNSPLQRPEEAARLHGCQQLRTCDAYGSCVSRQVCGPVCPDGYSCYPLYGAYGPYGGASYWGGYTNLGWGYRAW